MTFSNINVSTPNDGLGDKLRNAFIKVNDNFAQMEDQVSLIELNTILDSYSTITYVDSKDTILQNQINIFDNRLNEIDISIEQIQSDVTGLGLLVDGKASLTQLNNSISNINNTIAALEIEINNKIDDAPVDGLIYGRQDNHWVEVTGGGPSIYVALLSQVDNSDPTDKEVVNTTGAIFTYRYVAAGHYKITTDIPVFDENKTVVFYTAYDRKTDPGILLEVSFQYWAPNEMHIFASDNKLRNASLEIRTYN
jgi:hypothetical protein